MKVIWSNLAEQQLDQSIAFVTDLWDMATGQRLLQESRRISRLLSTHPHIGHPEPLLANWPLGYRSIVIGRYNKMIYYIKESTIHISAIWDTRRDPSVLANEVSFE